MLVKWLKRILNLALLLFIIVNVMAAFHAYQFTHFYEDAAPPKKPEQMSLGEKTKTILVGVKYAKSKVADSFRVPHETVLLTTEDGYLLESWYAQHPKARGTILLFHDQGSSKSGIIKEAEAFYRMGYHVFMTDFRAHGNSQGKACSIGVSEAKDVKAAFDYISAGGESNITLWGISMGAVSVLRAIHEFNLKPARLILEMPFGSLHSSVKSRMRTMHLPVEPMGTLLTFWAGVEQGFWAFDHQPQQYATKVNCPVLLQWGINDQRVTEAETHAVFKNFASHDKTMIKYAHAGHESLCKKEYAKWELSISHFLDE